MKLSEFLFYQTLLVYIHNCMATQDEGCLKPWLKVSFPSTHVPLLIPPYCSVHASLICEDHQHKSHGVKEKTTTIKVFPG